MSYDEAPTKLAHRAAALAYAGTGANKGKALLYLDDPHGGATDYFLAHGVARDRLLPVNHDRSDVILERTGVAPIKKDVHDYLEVTSRRFAFVWLDLQSVSLPDTSLRRALTLADFVGITLSTRCKGVDTVLAWARRAVREANGTVLEAGSYVGISGRPDMVRVVATRTEVWTTTLSKQRAHFAKHRVAPKQRSRLLSVLFPKKRAARPVRRATRFHGRVLRARA